MAQHGTFVWHDLMTKDIAGSHRFYAGLFGWRSPEKDADLARAHYVHLQAGERHVGGMIPLDPKDRIPSHWIGYVSTEDVDGTVEKAKAGGGKVHMPPRDIDVGRFAVLADPQGAAFAVFRYTKPEAAHEGKPAPSTFCWDELYTSDLEAARRFYPSLFGWKSEAAMEMGEHGTYWLFKVGERNAAGMMKMMPGVPHPFWLPYVAVTDADRTVAKAKELGAHVVVPPTDIPNVGRFAVFLDPQQASMGILQGA